MKKFIFPFLLLIIFFSFQRASAQDNSPLKNMTRLGALSPDTENEGSEKDPMWKPPVKERPRYLVKQTTGAKTKLIDHPKAQEIINKIAATLSTKEFDVAILSQHKYMINSCLGIKASVGEFKMKLGNPVAKLETGGIFLQFTIDKVTINALTIRVRPCTKDLQCHFGGRFDVGGTASDVRLEIRLNPLIDLQNCQVFGGAFSPRFKWRIGGLNLKPLQNNLDEMAKNLIEDALTASAIILMPNQLMDATVSAIFDSNLCSGAPEANNNNGDQGDNGDSDNGSNNGSGDLEDRLRQLEDRVTALENKMGGNQAVKTNAANSPNKTNEQNAASENEKWVITSSGQKGATGVVSVNLPEEASWNLFFKTTENKHLVSLNRARAHNMIPGQYNIEISAVTVLGVPVQKGMNTRLKAGTLHVLNPTGFMLYDETEKINYVSYSSSMKLGLPVGRYSIYLNGQFQKIEIKDGEVTEF